MEMKVTALRWILDAIFPKFCLKCGTEGVWICHVCVSTLMPYSRSGCVICKKASVRDVCGDCADHSPVSFLFSAYSYTDPFVRKIVHTLKYEYITDIGIIMGQLLARAVRNQDFFPTDACVIPVPIHIRRLRDRGFNQSEIFGRVVAVERGVPYISRVLQRCKNTPSQVDLSKDERLHNVSGAFFVHDNNTVRDKNIVLIDDVCTSGATLCEAAQVLRDAGAKNVIGVTFAREE